MEYMSNHSLAFYQNVYPLQCVLSTMLYRIMGYVYCWLIKVEFHRFIPFNLHSSKIIINQSSSQIPCVSLEFSFSKRLGKKESQDVANFWIVTFEDRETDWEALRKDHNIRNEVDDLCIHHLHSGAAMILWI